ncbi:uncharacterized protein LOC143606782 isoform X1 [Bidens hawaiensis]|uniref:uncharacterized protein LOC143606782 isoform X1 n=1 Tax=Bidens hawaiensis TaxID=980011 RepID=UPI004048F9D2
MATVSASPSIYLSPVFKPHKNPKPLLPTSCSLRLSNRCITIPNSYPNLLISQKRLSSLNKIRLSAAEEEPPVVVQEEELESSSSSQGEPEATVAVPVSRSDMLTMFFKAEGSMSEAVIPSITSALEETDDVSNLRVQVLEGIAGVELKKKTTVQATGVASNLVEILQNSGFKLQTLSLSFDDDAN